MQIIHIYQYILTSWASTCKNLLVLPAVCGLQAFSSSHLSPRLNSTETNTRQHFVGTPSGMMVGHFSVPEDRGPGYRVVPIQVYALCIPSPLPRCSELGCLFIPKSVLGVSRAGLRGMARLGALPVGEVNRHPRRGKPETEVHRLVLVKCRALESREGVQQAELEFVPRRWVLGSSCLALFLVTQVALLVLHLVGLDLLPSANPKRTERDNRGDDESWNRDCQLAVYIPTELVINCENTYTSYAPNKTRTAPMMCPGLDDRPCPSVYTRRQKCCRGQW